MEPSEVNVTKKGTTPQEREAIIGRLQESGKSKKDFCIENNINYCTLMSWLTPQKKHKSKLSKQEQRFEEVKILPQTTGELFARISFEKYSVELLQPVSADYLRLLLK